MKDFLHDRIVKVDALAGCFMMIRGTALEEVGLFDERYFIYSEETDLCKRFQKAGWDILYLPEVSVVHNHGASTAKDPVRFAVEQQCSLLKYWHKHHSFPSQLCLYVLLILHHAIRYSSGYLMRAVVPAMKDRAVQRMEQNRECLKALFQVQKSS
jgi:hypothetical protein